MLSCTYSCLNPPDSPRYLIRLQHHRQFETIFTLDEIGSTLTVNRVVRQIRAPKPSFIAENYRAHNLR